MSMNHPTIGLRAPEFCLPAENSIEICLEQFSGKWVVLYFYPKDNTPGCTLEAIDFSREVETFKSMDCTVIGVSPDSPKKHCSFREKHNLQVLLLSDELHEVLKKYGVWILKKMYGREYYGVLRSTFLIDPEGSLSFMWTKVKVKDHVKSVIQKLREMREI
jgi:peroxiredoxin Q/BCP